MPRRPPDTELCEEFSRKVLAAISGKLRKKTAAAVLGVSRQMLDLYLNRRCTPGPDVVLRAMKAWNLTLRYRGRELTALDLARPTAVELHAGAEQLLLPLKDALHALSEEDLHIKIIKKEANRVELQVAIKFAG